MTLLNLNNDWLVNRFLLLLNFGGLQNLQEMFCDNRFRSSLTLRELKLQALCQAISFILAWTNFS
jgi:hypothetical protein